MGLFDRFKKRAGKEVIEIIEWLDDTHDSLVYRFPVHDQQIKMGAKLTVRENQLALFVNEGVMADTFEPGFYELQTRNIPILTTLRGWKHGFRSPFKAEVYFFNVRIFADMKWGTSQPVMMRDEEFGMVRVRAFGTYAMKIENASMFFSTIVGTKGLTTTDEITGQLRSIILTRFSDALAESGIPALDLSSNYDELSALGAKVSRPEFARFGLALSHFYVENISLPDDVQAAIDQRSRLGVLGDKLGDYTRLQTAEAITMAASSPGGAAGAGVGLGAGVAMGQVMGQAMGNGPPAPTAPPAPAAAATAVWTLCVDGRNYGPYTEQALRDMVGRGQVGPDTLAWKPGATGWGSLVSYPDFADLASPPPPPPGKS